MLNKMKKIIKWAVYGINTALVSILGAGNATYDRRDFAKQEDKKRVNK